MARELQQVAQSALTEGDYALAVSAQVAADIHRALTTLWRASGGALNPFGEYFSRAARILADIPDVPVNARPGSVISGLRNILINSAANQGIPLLFPPSPIPDGLAPIDWEAAVTSKYGTASLHDIEQRLLAEAQSLPPSSDRLALIVEAFLIAEARALGDTALITVLPTLPIVLKAIPARTSEGGALVPLDNVLGEVRAIRLATYARPLFRNFGF